MSNPTTVKEPSDPEKIYLDWFFKQKDFEYQVISRPDPPDFIVAFEGKKIAVEITLVNYESIPNRKGSKRRQQESHHAQWLKKLSDAYYDKNNIPIWLKILLPSNFDLHQEAFNDIQAILNGSDELDVWENKSVELSSSQGTIKLFINRLPEELEKFSQWSYINDHVGFIAKVTKEHIENALRRKKRKLNLYRPNCDEVWLLLVVDQSSRSGFLQYGDDFEFNTGDWGFDSVWLLEYLNKTHQLLGRR